MTAILLIIATAACLITGIVTANLLFTYISLGLALLASLLLFGDLVRRRREVDPAGTGGTDDGGSDDGERTDTAINGTVDTPTGTSEQAGATAESKTVTSEAVAPGTATSHTAASADAASSAEATDIATDTAGTNDELPSAALDSFPLCGGDAVAAHEPRRSGEADLGAEVVLVVPGRKRFHRDDCRLLGSRTTEELTLNEAREEGFTPCTTCTAEALVPAH